MKRLLVLVVILSGLATLRTLSLADGNIEPSPFTPFDESPPSAPVPAPAIAPMVDVQQLRAEFLELSQQFAQEVDSVQLREEMDRLKRCMAETAAEKKVRQAREMLEQVISDFPETPAAAEAESMLNQSRGSATFGAASAMASVAVTGGQRSRECDRPRLWPDD